MVPDASAEADRGQFGVLCRKSQVEHTPCSPNWAAQYIVELHSSRRDLEVHDRMALASVRLGIYGSQYRVYNINGLYTAFIERQLIDCSFSLSMRLRGMTNVGQTFRNALSALTVNSENVHSLFLHSLAVSLVFPGFFLCPFSRPFPWPFLAFPLLVFQPSVSVWTARNRKKL